MKAGYAAATICYLITLLLPACSANNPPYETAIIPENRGLLVPEDGDGNITLYISTECLFPVPTPIEVYLDGSPIIRGQFCPGSLHPFYVKYRFDWPKGHHQLKATSTLTNSTVYSELDVSDNLWIVITHGYQPDPEQVTIRLYDRPVQWF